jgi:hypothetical protein
VATITALGDGLLGSVLDYYPEELAGIMRRGHRYRRTIAGDSATRADAEQLVAAMQALWGSRA